ncbi:hypothetical protein VTN02DRAFT_1172 [Thermoascus thermophilus]
MNTLTEKIASLESQLATERGDITSLQADLQAKQALVEQLQQGLASLEERAQGHDAGHEAALQQLRDEAAAAARSLEEQTREAMAAAEQHAQALEALKAEHAAELDRVKAEASASSGDAVRELQAKYDELLASKTELEARHAQQIESLRAELQASREEHASTVGSVAESQQKAIDEALAKLRAELEASYHAKTAQLDDDHSRAIEELLTAHDAKLSNLRADLEAANAAKVAELQQSHEAALGDLNEQLVKAKAAVEDNAEAERLKQQISALDEKLAHAEKAAATAEELAARHAEEVSRLQQEKAELAEKYQATSAQLEEQLRTLSEQAQAQSDVDSVLKQLASVHDELAQLKETHAQVCAELDEARLQNKAMEEKVAKGEKDLNDQIGKNMSLVERLGDVDTAISASRRRVRELEAELAALKKDDATPGLEASRWANAEDGKNGPAGEDLGSSIEGTMASIQEQLKQLNSANDDWYDEHKRILSELARVSQQRTPSPPGSHSATPYPPKSPAPDASRDRGADHARRAGQEVAS